MKPHLWQSDQWSAGTAEGDRGNLPVACGDGLVEASLSWKTTPDWTDYLFCSGQLAKERVAGVVPCMLVPGWRDESPLPRPSHGCEVRSREILLPCLPSALLCFPGWEKFPHGFLRVLLHLSPEHKSLPYPCLQQGPR